MAKQLKTKLLNTVTGGGPVDPVASPATGASEGSDDGADVRAPKSSNARAAAAVGATAGCWAARGPQPLSAPTGRRFLSYDDLLERGIPYSRMHLRRLENAGHFPMHVELGAGNHVQTMIAWLLVEIEEWERERIAKRDAKRRMKQTDVGAPAE